MRKYKKCQRFEMYSNCSSSGPLFYLVFDMVDYFVGKVTRGAPWHGMDCNHDKMLLWSNGRSWIYSISLLASQYSFDSSLEV